MKSENAPRGSRGPSRHKLALLSCAALAGLSGFRARAAGITYTYTGANNSNWNTASNWSPGSGPPGNGDTAFFSVASASAFTLNFNTQVYTGTGLTALYIDPFGAGSLTLLQNNAASVMTAAGEFIGNGDAPTSTYTQSAGQNNAGTLSVGSASTGNGVYNLSGGNVGVGTQLILANASNSTGIFNLSGVGVLSAANPSEVESVGFNGTGTFNQSGGSNVALLLHVGENASATGTYNLSAGTLDAGSTVTGNEQVGYNGGTGVFNQTGGTNSTFSLVVGGLAGRGTYGMSNASTLNVTGALTVGNAAVGVFNQTGGTVTTPLMFMGIQGSGSGTYTLGGGSLTLNSSTGSNGLYIGLNSKAVFNQTTGSVNVSGTAALGFSAFASGTYNMTNGTATFTGGLTVGQGGAGTFIQSGGSVSASTLGLGAGTASTGTYSLSGSGSSLNLGGNSQNEFVGQDGTGLFNQSGGTNNGQSLLLGYDATGVGTYNLSNTASLTMGNVPGNSGGEFVGVSGKGTFNQTGGSNTTLNLAVGYQTAASSGVYNLSGGTLQATSLEYIGGFGVGVFNQTSGTNITPLLGIGVAPGASGTYTQSGGQTLVSGTVYLGGYSLGAGGLGILNVNGGSFSATNTVTLFGNNSALNVGGGTVTVGLVNVGTTGNASITQTAGSITGSFINLSAGTSGAGSGTYTLSGAGSLLSLHTPQFGGELDVGQYGVGLVNQTAGSMSLDGLVLGDNVGAVGTFNMSNSASVTEQTFDVGNHGQGIFNQTGGTQNCAANGLYMGGAATGSGTYTLSGGNLLAGVEYLGVLGKANFNQSGGTNSTATLNVAGLTGSTGTYTQSGGQALVSGNVYVGGSASGIGGTGTVNVTGGTFNATGSVTVFNNSSFFYVAGGTVSANSVAVPDWSRFQVKNGTLNLGSGNSTNPGGWVIGLASGTATVNQNISGSVVGVGGLYLSDAVGGVANYNLGAGATLTNTLDEILGDINNSTANFTQNGGLHTIAGTLQLAPSGNSFGTFTLNAGTVTLAGSAYIGGNPSFGAAGVGVLDVNGGSFNAGTNTVTLFNTGVGFNTTQVQITGGTFSAGNLVNNGSFLVYGGTATVSNVTGTTGSLIVGPPTGSAPAILNLASFNQPLVNISSGGRLTILASGTSRSANTATDLEMVGTGVLDLTQNTLTTQTALSTIRTDLHAAYASGTWTGAGITSANAIASPSTLGIAYVANTSTASVFLRPSLIGDTNLDGKVNGLDTRQIYTSGAFNDGKSTHDWSVGDMNYDGVVNGLDTRLIYTSGNFNNPAQTFTATTKLTSPAADPTLNPITIGNAGDAKPDLIYNPNTGDVAFTKDGDAATVVEILLHSDAGSFNVANFNASTGATANANTLDVQSGTGFSTYDFGDVLPTGMTPQQVLAILKPYDSAHDPSGLGASGIYVVNDPNEHFYDVLGTPEPASLSLAGLAAASLLNRRQRRK